jgi:cystathionine gamma-synthase
LKEAISTLYEDVCWPQDVVFLERNSRDFIHRIHRVNASAYLVCQTLISSPHVKRVFYPSLNPSRHHYDAFRTPEGGYGGLLSVVFHDDEHAVTFYDAIETAKGPSLGTNFTLTSPYTILAHYTELEWARRYGVERGLVRISVGLEEREQIVRVFKEALGAIGKSGAVQQKESKRS